MGRAILSAAKDDMTGFGRESSLCQCSANFFIVEYVEG